MRISLLMLLLFFCSCQKKAEIKAKQDPIAVVTKAVKQTLPLQIETFGIAKSNLSVWVTSQVTGQLQKKMFTDGDFVQKEEALFLIDPLPYKARLQQAEGAVDQSLIDVELAQRTLARFSELAPNEYVSHLDYDKYKFELLAKEAILKINSGKLEESKINLGYCYIHSPISGIIGKSQIDTGNYLDKLGTRLVSIHQIDPIYVEFNITTPQLMQILDQSNDKTLQCQAVSEEKVLNGNLVFVDNGVDTNTATTLLKARFSNLEHAVYPGQFVNLKLLVKEIPCKAVVPSNAVMMGQKGHYVFLVKDGKAQMQAVSLGINSGDVVQITSGIEEGELVVISGQINLESGKNVQIKFQDTK